MQSGKCFASLGFHFFLCLSPALSWGIEADQHGVGYCAGSPQWHYIISVCLSLPVTSLCAICVGLMFLCTFHMRSMLLIVQDVAGFLRCQGMFRARPNKTCDAHVLMKGLHKCAPCVMLFMCVSYINARCAEPVIDTHRSAKLSPENQVETCKTRNCN